MDHSVYWIWLTAIPSVGPVTQKKLLVQLRTPQAVYEAQMWDLLRIPGVGPAVARRIMEARSLSKAEKILDQMNRKGIHLLTWDDPRYPEEVKHLPTAPVILYYRGKLGVNSLGVGVIGTRRCTPYGKQVAIEAASCLARTGIAVISGLSRGIDGYAHTACLKEGGYTLAFLGCGVDICYPQEHRPLMEKMTEQGAVLSPYPPGTPVHRRHFYLRNFLISAWSSKLLVVEAGEKSSTMMTVHYARKLGREIWAVPNQIYSPESRGTNRLIAEGASVYLDPQQLTPQVLGAGHSATIQPSAPAPVSLQSPPSHRSTGHFIPLETEIVGQLRRSPVSIDQLARQMNTAPSEMIEHLSVLELEGMIRIRPNHMVELIREDK